MIKRALQHPSFLLPREPEAQRKGTLEKIPPFRCVSWIGSLRWKETEAVLDPFPVSVICSKSCHPHFLFRLLDVSHHGRTCKCEQLLRREIVIWIRHRKEHGARRDSSSCCYSGSCLLPAGTHSEKRLQQSPLHHPL